jgi:hypothetical protein
MVFSSLDNQIVAEASALAHPAGAFFAFTQGGIEPECRLI